MADYAFLTTWLLESPREPVWEAIYDQERWPEWWRGVEEVEERDGGDDGGVGSVSRMVWKSLLPYRVEFEVTTTQRRAAAPAARPTRSASWPGSAAGASSSSDGVTAVLYEWNVATTKPWMNLLAPIARPAFEWNHDWVMARGGEGIAQLLGCHLLASG